MQPNKISTMFDFSEKCASRKLSRNVRAISGRETIPVRTPFSAEFTKPVPSLLSNAIATLIFQLIWSTKVNDKLFHLLLNHLR